MSLPAGFISTRDVLDEKLSGPEVRRLEFAYGNEELLYGLDLIGVGGPFYRVTPWELEDERGVRNGA